MSTFTKVLPENYDGNYNDWYFDWHPPRVDAMTQARRWEKDQVVTVLVPDPTVRRGTGNPEPAAKLGGFARQNTEGWNWCWMPMADFAVLMSQPAQAADPDAANQETKKRDETLRSHLRAAQAAMDDAIGVLGGRGASHD